MSTKTERQRAMKRLLRSWRQSGESIQRFCAKRQIPVSTFFRWKSLFKADAVVSASSPDTVLPPFVPVGPLPFSGRFEYRFPDGHCLVMPGTLNISDIASVVRGLRTSHD